MFEFQHTTKIMGGAGSLANSGKAIATLGNKALIACDPFAVQTGLAGRLADILAAAGVKSVIFDKVIPNPTTDIVDAGGALARAEKCNVIIGLGGGSSMDTAKAVAVAASHDGPIWPYAIYEKQPTDATLPIVAITTTSGTGSQCTPFAVITNPKTNQKPGFGGPCMFPRIAVVDPELTATMPPRLTAVTGLDVFTHAIEAYTSKWASPVTDMYAMRAIELMAASLPRAYADGSDLAARESMAVADTYAGIAISHAGVSAAHVLAHVIGGHFHDIAHGDALNTVYPAILELNKSGLPEKHEWVAKTLSGGKTKDVAAAYRNFFGKFDFPNRLKGYNPDSGKIRKMAEDVFSYMELYATLGPVEVNAAAMEKVLQASL
jgi:alcohol dehydrogenase class IV